MNKIPVDYDLLIKLGTDKCWVKNLFLLRKNNKKKSLLRDALHNSTIKNLDKLYLLRKNFHAISNKEIYITDHQNTYLSSDEEEYKFCFVDIESNNTEQELELG